MTEIVIQGIGGRMGHVLCDMIAQRDDCCVVAGIDVKDGEQNGIPVYDSLEKLNGKGDVVIDFSSPAAVEKALPYCEAHKLPIVVCTTGLSEELQLKVVQLSRTVPVFKSANMSMGINVLSELCKRASAILGVNYDVEIVEQHHHNKLDAPSGTALMLADAINEQNNGAYHYVYDRSSVRQKRDPKEIGISSVRGGSIVGDHEVLFCGPDEVITLSVGMEKLKPVLFPILAEVLRADGQTIAGIYERNDEALRAKEGLEQNKGWFDLPGETHPESTQTEICENGVFYHVDFENGQKTGFFLDQKYNRRAVARLAAGHTVLDCFTHTGSFALNAAKGGAARVTAADISADAIAMAKRNAERNGLTNMDFLCEDTFALLPRLEKEGHPYDFIILDPPAFTKARRTVENAMRGYKEINYRAMKLLPRGGYLATASCSHFATEELFIKMLKAAAKDAHRQLRQIEVKQQAPDHPILWGVPETNYLKFFLFQVI